MSTLDLRGRLGHLTENEDKALADFKALISTKDGYYDPERHDDHIILRFLRARKFNLEQTDKMWSDYIEWFKSFKVDDICENFEFPEYPIVKKHYPRFYHQTDKLGRPLYIELLGSVDVKQLFQVTTTERMLQNHVYEYEKLLRYRLAAVRKKFPDYIEQSCTILDLKGVYLSTFSSVFSLVKQVSSIAQNYYPEMLGKMFIINAPFLFTTVWSLVKPLLDEVTVSKIDILGSGYSKKLLEFIDADKLPKMFGGTCECEGGCELSDVGPWSDGSVEGFPQKHWEKFNIQFGQVKDRLDTITKLVDENESKYGKSTAFGVVPNENTKAE